MILAVVIILVGGFFSLVLILAGYAINRQNKIVAEIGRRVDEAVKKPPADAHALKRELIALAGTIGSLDKMAEAMNLINLIPDRNATTQSST